MGVNQSAVDRTLRVLLGVALLYLGWFGVAPGVLGLVLKAAGFLPLLTGCIGFCPGYSLLGVSTAHPLPHRGIGGA